MKLPRNAKIFRGQLDVAPFAGVFFLLLMFLTLSSKLVYRPGVQIELPQAASELPGTTELTVSVAIDVAGQIYYRSQAIGEQDLALRLREEVERSPEPLVLEIQADRASRLEPAFRLMDLASQVGFRKAVIISRPMLTPVDPGNL